MLRWEIDKDCFVTNDSFTFTFFSGFNPLVWEYYLDISLEISGYLRLKHPQNFFGVILTNCDMSKSLNGLGFRCFEEHKSNPKTLAKKGGAAIGWFLIECAHEFLFCWYTGKLLVLITAFLLLPLRNPNVKASDFLFQGYTLKFLLMHTQTHLHWETWDTIGWHSSDYVMNSKIPEVVCGVSYELEIKMHSMV